MNNGSLISILSRGSWQGPKSGLLHRWPLENSTILGRTAVDVVARFNGTLGSGCTVSQGPKTTAVVISDDANGYISLTGPPFDFTKAFTIGFWAWRSTLAAPFDTGGPRLFCFNNAGGTDYLYGQIVQTGGGTAGAYQGARVSNANAPSAGTNAAAIAVSTWTHLCYTFDGGTTAVIYVNGSSVTLSGTLPQNGGTTGSNWVIGARSAGARPWGGRLYQFVIYQRTLSSSDVTQLVNAQ